MGGWRVKWYDGGLVERRYEERCGEFVGVAGSGGRGLHVGTTEIVCVEPITCEEEKQRALDERILDVEFKWQVRVRKRECCQSFNFALGLVFVATYTPRQPAP